MVRARYIIRPLLLAALVALPVTAQERTPPDGAGAGNCLTSGCHAPLSQGAVVHEVVIAEACEMCHEHTGSGHRFAAPAPIAETCVSCHDDPAAATGRVHGPVADGRCTACHDPHRSDHGALLLRESPALCWKCHSTAARRKDGRAVRPVRGEVEGVVLVHGAVEMGCESCHPPHAAEQRGLFTDTFPAGPYARGFDGTYDLCFGCHEESMLSAADDEVTEFRDGVQNLHAVHVARPKSRSCALCHSPHGGGPHLVRTSAPFGGWDMPIGYEETAGGGRCASACHSAREYVRGVPVLKDAGE